MPERSASAMRLGMMGAAVAVALIMASCGAPPTPPPLADAVEPGPELSAAPAVTDTELALPRSVPVELSIPAISVETTLMDLGLTATGALAVPPEGFPAGWFTGAPTPGQHGPAIIAGHVSHSEGDAVFHDLHQLDAGDEVFVLREDGTTAVFRVDSVEQYPKDAFPTAAVYGDIDHAGLRLITCGGEFDWDVLSHRDNIVVFAHLIRVDIN